MDGGGKPPVPNRRLYGSPVGMRYRPPGNNDETFRRRCGARVARDNRAVEVADRTLLTQSQYDAKLSYAITTRKMEVLMQSISTGTKTGYTRSWSQWGNFCRGKNQSVWLDSREEGCGGNLLNFILSERDVLGLRASTIRGKLVVYDSSTW